MDKEIQKLHDEGFFMLPNHYAVTLAQDQCNIYKKFAIPGRPWHQFVQRLTQVYFWS